MRACLVTFCLASSCLLVFASCAPAESRELRDGNSSHNANLNTNSVIDAGPDEAAAAVKDLYSLISRDPVNIINIIPQGGFYRVTFEVLSSQRVEQSVFVSRDGVYLSEAITDLQHRGEPSQSSNQPQCL